MKRLVSVLFASAFLLAFAAPPAMAAEGFGLKDLDVTFTNEDGSPAAFAGSHPYAVTFDLASNTEELPGGEVFPIGSIKDILIEQPSGFAGNPTAVPRCPAAVFLKSAGDSSVNCPNETVLGKTAVAVGKAKDISESTPVPVYNMVPPPGAVLKLGFVVVGVPVTIEVGLSPTYPFNPLVKVTNISQATEFYAAKTTVWGNPTSSVHDAERGTCLESGEEDLCPVTGVEEKPFITLPRSCTGPLVTFFEIDSWQDPGVWIKSPPVESHDNSVPPEPLGLGGCGELRFEPRVDSEPTTDRAESPSGLDFDLEIDDEGIDSPTGRAQSDMKKVVVTLPEGMTANPSLAEGLGVCSEAGFEGESLTSAPGEGCPQASKIGTVEAESPLLEGEILHGQLFIAEPNANPFDSLLALYLVIRNPELGVLVKLPGKIEPDPQTGQLITTFGEAPYEIPQFPVSHLRVHLREGGRSPLVTPPSCGSFSVDAEFTPWADPENPVTISSPFSITKGTASSACPPGGVPPFSPGFLAGSINNNAGSYSPFFLQLTRSDGEQDLTRFSAVLPPGVTGKIAGVGRCSDAQIASAAGKSGRAEQASPSCPVASQLGRVTAGAGVGSELTYASGSLYLAGPYKGAPLSVVSIVPAVAGPFDVGTIVTRVGLKLNPDTAQVEVDGASSDPIPHILEGIPLKVRDIRVYTDRPEFTLNPTSCDPSAAVAQIFGSFADVFNPADDVAVGRTARYQAASCTSLAFKPKLQLSLKGGTTRSANTGLRAVFTTRPGDANLKGAEVILPPSQFIDNAHINNPCTRVQFAAGACPPSSVLGRIRAFTPLLDDPLEGPVYFRSNGGERLLPDVVGDLNGQFRFILVIAILRSKNERVRTKVLNSPDAPVSKVILTMAGGKKGLLENSENLCRKPQRANLNLTGQNNSTYNTRPVVKTSCKSKKTSRPHAKRR